MQTTTSWSLLPRISAILLVLTLSPLATLAQDDGVLPAVRQFSIQDILPMSPRVGEAFNEAVAALNAGRFEVAGDAIGKLRLDRLSSYERGKAERVLFNVAYAEKDFTVARQHLVNALESGGLDEPETAAAREQIRRINAQLGSAPPE